MVISTVFGPGEDEASATKEYGPFRLSSSRTVSSAIEGEDAGKAAVRGMRSTLSCSLPEHPILDGTDGKSFLRPGETRKPCSKTDSLRKEESKGFEKYSANNRPPSVSKKPTMVACANREQQKAGAVLGRILLRLVLTEWHLR